MNELHFMDKFIYGSIGLTVLLFIAIAVITYKYVYKDRNEPLLDDRDIDDEDYSEYGI